MSLVSAARVSAREARAVAALGSAHRPSPRVVIALARLETKKILLHPLFLGAMGLIMLFVALVGRGNGVILDLAGVAIGVAIGGFVSANAATRRARRDRVTELFASLASPPESRTLALLLATLSGPMLLSATFAELAVAIARARHPGDPNINLALALQLPLVLAALGALAIALGRWIPNPAIAPAFVVSQVAYIWVNPWIAETSSRIRLGWHFTYLGSVIAFGVVAAFARDRRSPVPLVVVGVALATLVLAEVFRFPPGGLH